MANMITSAEANETGNISSLPVSPKQTQSKDNFEIEAAQHINDKNKWILFLRFTWKLNKRTE